MSHLFVLRARRALLCNLAAVVACALSPAWASADQATCETLAKACGVATERALWLCFELDGATPRLVASHGTLESSHTLLPANRAVTVLVTRSDQVERLEIAQAGKQGVTVAEPRGTDAAPREGARTPAQTRCNAYVKTFGPRVVGDATLSITVTPRATPPPSSAPLPSIKYDFEAYVPKVYSGVFRLGVSATYDAALGKRYTTRQQLDGELHQVVDAGGSAGAIELVVGYAPFVWPRADGRAGRTFTDAYPARWRLSPYLGLGVLSTTSDGLQWLRSVYVGAELELAQGCSIALAGVLRRSAGLGRGLAVGDLVAKDTDVTRPTLSLGAGVVLNFTPEFLTFAASVLPK